MGHYPAIKRSKVLIHATTWINFENMMLSERKQSEKDTCFIIHYMSFWKSTETQKTIEAVKRSVVTGVGWRGGRIKHRDF